MGRKGGMGALFAQLALAEGAVSRGPVKMPASTKLDLADRDHNLYLSVAKWLRRRGQPVKPKLSYLQKKELKECFGLMDLDGSGAIDVDEFEEALGLLGISMSHKQVEQLFNEVDLDGTGQLEYDEFLEVMTVTLQRLADGDAEQEGREGGGQQEARLPFGLMSTAYRRKRYLEQVMGGNRGELADLVAIAESGVMPWEEGVEEAEVSQAARAQVRPDARKDPRAWSTHVGNTQAKALKRLADCSLDETLLSQLATPRHASLVSAVAAARLEDTCQGVGGAPRSGPATPRIVTARAVTAGSRLPRPVTAILGTGSTGGCSSGGSSTGQQQQQEQQQPPSPAPTAPPPSCTGSITGSALRYPYGLLLPPSRPATSSTNYPGVPLTARPYSSASQHAGCAPFLSARPHYARSTVSGGSSTIAMHAALTAAAAGAGIGLSGAAEAPGYARSKYHQLITATPAITPIYFTRPTLKLPPGARPPSARNTADGRSDLGLVTRLASEPQLSQLSQRDTLMGCSSVTSQTRDSSSGALSKLLPTTALSAHAPIAPHAPVSAPDGALSQQAAAARHSQHACLSDPLIQDTPLSQPRAVTAGASPSPSQPGATSSPVPKLRLDMLSQPGGHSQGRAAASHAAVTGPDGRTGEGGEEEDDGDGRSEPLNQGEDDIMTHGYSSSSHLTSPAQSHHQLHSQPLPAPLSMSSLMRSAGEAAVARHHYTMAPATGGAAVAGSTTGTYSPRGTGAAGMSNNGNRHPAAAASASGFNGIPGLVDGATFTSPRSPLHPVSAPVTAAMATADAVLATEAAAAGGWSHDEYTGATGAGDLAPLALSPSRAALGVERSSNSCSSSVGVGGLSQLSQRGGCSRHWASAGATSLRSSRSAADLNTVLLAKGGNGGGSSSGQLPVTARRTTSTLAVTTPRQLVSQRSCVQLTPRSGSGLAVTASGSGAATPRRSTLSQQQPAVTAAVGVTAGGLSQAPSWGDLGEVLVAQGVTPRRVIDSSTGVAVTATATPGLVGVAATGGPALLAASNYKARFVPKGALFTRK